MFNADPARSRYLPYRRLGKTGLKVSVISLGLKYNFTTPQNFKACREIVLAAFGNGINYFDLSGSYGSPAGTTEELFGHIIESDLLPYRDEIIISTKVGAPSLASEGPMSYGGSRKLIMSQVDKSLERLGIPYVDILFHENYDSDVNPDETALALADVVRQGKALYIGLTNYTKTQATIMAEKFKKYNVPFVGCQVRYNYLYRDIEDDGIVDAMYDGYQAGTMAYQPLAQGLLSNKYINEDIPANCRAKKEVITSLNEEDITEELRGTLTKINIVAATRAQKISQMALAWVLRNERIATAIVGVSNLNQLAENHAAGRKLGFTPDELRKLDGDASPANVKGKRR